MLMRDEVAGMGRRVGALVVDLVMLELAMIPLSLGLREMTPSPAAVRLLEFGVALVYSTVFLSGRGQTPGKTMASLRVLSADGGGVSQKQAFVRSLTKWAVVFAPLMALASLVPYPTTVQNLTIEPPAAPQAANPLASLATAGALVLWLVFLMVTRRHPDGQAPHDRIAGTYVVRVL